MTIARTIRETLFQFALAASLLGALAGAGFRSAAGQTPPVASVLQPFVDSHALAGAVTLVASKDKVLSLEAAGWADIAAKEPMRTDALFWIASESKPMTATALMMLVDEGKVSLADPVEKYLPEFKGQMVAVEQDSEHLLLRKADRPITVKDILSHTSGLPFVSRVEFRIDQHPLSEAVVSYALSPLNSQPGTRYQYSNAGINTAGRIIEVVSGIPYGVFMEQRLFKPLGMKDTTLWPSKSQLKRLAKSYKPNASKTGLEETEITQLTCPLDDRRRGPSPAGGYFSTARDMARFGQMLLNGGALEGKRYVSAEAIGEMTRKQTGDAIKENYGLGFSVRGASFGHGGAYSTDLNIDTERQLVTVFMVQHAGYAGADGAKILPAFRKAAEAFAQQGGGNQ
jgi:CubicO group peptidase (beta-lactamase class C family)